MPAKKIKATVLLSGGIDSAACVHFLQGRGYEIAGVFVDFGQASAAQETRCAQLLRDYFSIPLRVIRTSSQEGFSTGELAGRNAFLKFSALLLGGCREGLLVIGIHAGTPYFDCSPAFVARINPLIGECSSGRVSVLAPFVDWPKDEVYSYFLNARIPSGKDL